MNPTRRTSPCEIDHSVPSASVTRIWSPTDTERLRRDMAAHPATIGQSPMLRLILCSEGIEQ